MKWPVGGIRSYIAYNYPALLDSGFRVSFIGPDCPEFESFRDQFSDWRGVEFVPAQRNRRGYRFLRTIRSALRSGRYALIHSQGVSLAAIAVLSNLGIGVPHVCTSHYTFQAGPPMRGVQGALRRFILTRLLKRLDALIAVSRDALEDHLLALPGLRRASGRIVAIQHGIDTGRYNLERVAKNGSLRQLLGISDTSFLLGYFGRFMPEKGFPILVAAMELLASHSSGLDVHLVAVGSGDYEREYKRDVQSRSLVRDRISFLPFQADSSDFIRQVQLVVVPSYCEACGLLPMEAMCLGVPVLGSNCLGLREVFQGSPSRMVEPRDPVALARGIADAVRNPFSAEARCYVSTACERFDVRKGAAELAALLSQLIHASPFDQSLHQATGCATVAANECKGRGSGCSF